MGALTPLRSTLNEAVPGLGLGSILLGDFERFVKGFVFEIIDTRTQEAIVTKSLVLNPRSYILTEPFSVNLTPAEDNSVVAEENGIIIREIQIEGTTGLKHRKEEAFGRGGSVGTEASGIDHFKDLRALFRRYSDLKKNPAESPHIVMVFHNVKEDDHFVVAPRSFVTPRHAKKNRIHFEYSISLAAIQELPIPVKSADFDPFGIFSAVSKITKTINMLRTYLAETINEIETLRRRLRNPLLIIDDLALGLNELSALTEAIIGTYLLGREGLLQLTDLAEDKKDLLSLDIDELPDAFLLAAAQRFGKIEGLLPAAGEDPAVFPVTLGQISQAYSGARDYTEDDLEKNLAGATLGTRTRITLGDEADQGVSFGTFNSTSRYIVQATDTIDSIVARFNTPREIIVEANSLVFPYITRGGAPGTLQPGDTIIVPLRGGGASKPGVGESSGGGGGGDEGSYATPDELLYGIDIGLDMDLLNQGIFDIKIDEIHGSMDAELVSGVDNVVQGVGITINTERNSTNLLPGFGIKRVAGTRGTVDTMLMASLYLREAIVSDSRIEGIESINIVKTGDVLTQEITPNLKNRKAGDTLSIHYGKFTAG